MINSRDLKELHPIVANMCQQLINECKKENIDILITSTYRDFESQNALYNTGRNPTDIKNKVKIVTNAKAGESFHNYRVAFDLVPIINGKCCWDTNNKVWQVIGLKAEKIGLFWANNWVGFKELAHFQYTGKINDYNKALMHFKNGGKLEDLI